MLKRLHVPRRPCFSSALHLNAFCLQFTELFCTLWQISDQRYQQSVGATTHVLDSKIDSQQTRELGPPTKWQNLLFKIHFNSFPCSFALRERVLQKIIFTDKPITKNVSKYLYIATLFHFS